VQLAGPGSVDVIDADIETAAYDFASLLLIGSGMAAQSDGRDHKIGLAQPAVFHIRVVIANLGCINPRPSGDRGVPVTAGTNTHNQSCGDFRTVTHELTPGHSFTIHLPSPFVIAQASVGLNALLQSAAYPSPVQMVFKLNPEYLIQFLAQK